jgi:hypothetical protein
VPSLVNAFFVTKRIPNRYDMHAKIVLTVTPCCEILLSISLTISAFVLVIS